MQTQADWRGGLSQLTPREWFGGGTTLERPSTVELSCGPATLARGGERIVTSLPGRTRSGRPGSCSDGLGSPERYETEPMVVPPEHALDAAGRAIKL
jgi:hypothetical protein